MFAADERGARWVGRSLVRALSVALTATIGLLVDAVLSGTIERAEAERFLWVMTVTGYRGPVPNLAELPQSTFAQGRRWGYCPPPPPAPLPGNGAASWQAPRCRQST